MIVLDTEDSGSLRSAADAWYDLGKHCRWTVKLRKKMRGVRTLKHEEGPKTGFGTTASELVRQRLFNSGGCERLFFG
jgi:3-methyladenine DNA glycosylase AlkC